MSSDSQPSFRTYLKGKIKTGIKPNITASIRQSLISNETYQNVREKYHNFTDTAKDKTGIRTLMNRTRELLPGVFRSNNSETSRKGFYDSLFSPQTEDDVYIKVTVICLWVIAILCIIPTIITLFIPARNKQTKTTGVKMIFFHIFLCEFFYLIYILLSMINVAQDFQLNAVLCDIANYGMYITIPVMHFALLFLSIERITKLCKSTMAWTRIFTQAYVIQVILLFIWLIFIAIITTILLVKQQFSFKNIVDKTKDIAPPIFQDVGKKFVRPYQCSIDGRLSSLFKILFIILFIILIVLIIKSMVVSIFYNFFTPKCCNATKKKKTSNDHHITLLYIMFLLLNFFFSYPFYFVSMAHSILKHFISTNDTFEKRLKICFILRIISIILQCLAFSTFENNSWSLLSGLLYRGTCKKIPALNNGIVYTRKPRPNTDGDDNEDDNTDENETEDNDSDDNEDDDRDKNENEDNGSDENEDVVNNQIDDDVFVEEEKSKLQKAKKSETTVPVTTDEDHSDEEKQLMQKSKTSTKNTNEEKKVPIRKTTAKYSNTNSISNGKSTSHRISSVETSKPNTKKHSIQVSSSSDEISDASVDSDDEIKPSTASTKKQPATDSSLNEQKRTTSVLPKEHDSHHQQHRTKHSQVSRPRATTSSNHHHVKPTEKRSNNNNHSEKPKQHRHKKIYNNSDEV